MIESIMYFTIGFFAAALSVLIVMPLVHGRAVRLTTRRLEAALPASTAEVVADKDVLRADFAMSTRRLEIKIEQLKTNSASQLAELGRKADAINRLKIERDALRDQLRAGAESTAVKVNTACGAERASSEKESELAKLSSTLDERAALADLQKAEIAALTLQVHALKERLARTDDEARAAEDRRVIELRDAERALAEKESELAKLRSALDQRSGLADLHKAETAALTLQVQRLEERLAKASEEARTAEDRRAAAVRDADGALAEKELELANLRSALDQRSVLADSQNAEIAELTSQVQTLQAELAQASEEARTAEDRRAAAVRDADGALAEKELELAKLRSALDQRSALADSQNAEIAALTRQVQTLQGQLAQAAEEARAAEDRRAAERSHLKAATAQLMEERVKFEDFHRRVAELVRRVVAQATEDKIWRRSQENLENRLVEQSRLLNERERELNDLREEIATARKTESDLRITAQDFSAENSRLQAVLDRANGERVRLTYELTTLRRRLEHTEAA